MALNISLLFIPWPIFLIALILVVAAIIVLTLVRRRIHRDFVAKKEEEDTYYLKKLRAVKTLKGEPDKFLSALDGTAREFFEEEFQITGARYSDLIERFEERHEREAVKFCEVMQEELYSGEKLEEGQLKFLFNSLTTLVKIQERGKLKDRNPEKKREEVVVAKPTKLIETKQTRERPGKEIGIDRKKEKKSWFGGLFGSNREFTPPRKLELQKEDKVNMRIVQYLLAGRERHFELVQLKEKLLDGGFNKEAIELAVQYVKRKVMEGKAPLDRPKVLDLGKKEEEKKTMVAKFFHPKHLNMESIKKEVGEAEEKAEKKERIPKAKPIEVVPFKKEKIKTKKKEYPKREPKRYSQIGGLDDLDRLRKKIDERRKDLGVGD